MDLYQECGEPLLQTYSAAGSDQLLRSGVMTCHRVPYHLHSSEQQLRSRVSFGLIRVRTDLEKQWCELVKGVFKGSL